MSTQIAFPSALDRLRALPRFGSGPGLHRMAALRDALLAGLPPGGSTVIPPAIHVTGSNGKGTVAHLVAAILHELGVSTLLYTSPHVVRFEERYRLDGEPVPTEELERAAARVLTAVESYRERFPEDHIAGFEALTAVALDLALRRRPEIVVAEAGIGGRFDSTRVFPGSVTAVTTVELEHREILGPTLLDIAFDKAELCPDGGVLVTGEVDAEILRRIRGALELRGSRLVPVSEALRWTVREVVPDGMFLDVGSADGSWIWEGLESALVGRHQATNVAVAVQLVREWLAVTGTEAPSQGLAGAVRRGLRATRIPGRFQRLDARRLWGRVGEVVQGSGPEVFVDVAHTPTSLAALAETVQAVFGDRPRVLVLGISEGREPDMLRSLLPGTDIVVSTSSRYRGRPAETLSAGLPLEEVEPRCELRVETAPGLGAALGVARRAAGALRKATGREPVVLVTGSYFLAAEVAALAAGEDPDALGFPER